MSPHHVPTLDLLLLLDTTGSMGTTLSELRRQLAEVVAEIQDCQPGLRCGVVAFKDHGEDYLTRCLPLSDNLDALVRFVRSPRLRPGVGGGGAEAVECALRAANGFNWRKKSRKVVVLIGDKPPHGAGLDGFDACACAVDYRDEIEQLAALGVVVYTVRVGSCLETQRVFEYFSARTGGVFLDGLHVRDLPSSIVSVCSREAGELRSYHRRLARRGQLTHSRQTMMLALAS